MIYHIPRVFAFGAIGIITFSSCTILKAVPAGLPGMADEYCHESYDKYRNIADEGNKALAISKYGQCFSYRINIGTPEQIREYVLETCKRTFGAECYIFAVNDAVLWDPKHDRAELVLHLRKAGQYRLEGNLDAAITEYEKAKTLDADDPLIHLTLGQLLCDKEEYKGAVTEFQTAVRLDPKSADAHHGLGFALERENQEFLEKALEQYRIAISLDPNDAHMHISMALALTKRGNLDAAMSEYERAIELNGTASADAEEHIGSHLIPQKDTFSWPSFENKSVSQDKSYAHLMIGWVLRDNGNNERALLELRRAVNLNPYEPLNHIGLAYLYIDTKQFDKAISEADVALSLGSNNLSVILALGLALYQKGDFDRAIVELENAKRLRPDERSIRALLAIALRGGGYLDVATQEFRTLVQEDPKDYDAHYEFASTLDQQGLKEEAISEYRTAIQLDPNNAEVHAKLGKVLKSKGDTREAREEFEKALILSQKNAANEIKINELKSELDALN